MPRCTDSCQAACYLSTLVTLVFVSESGSEEHLKMESASIERDEEHYSETHEGTRNGKKKQNKKIIEGVYEQFLELPVPIVLSGMWVLGAALIVLCVLVLDMCWLLLAATV